ncbi:metal-sulfur cluster assembly factor [Agriterribacter sp.]|uniref:metal-sulfur cluster assembly factor n=1 Tax=Agriterribacter sp. TaxID=2821509 RepID=UPI002C245E20|nr:metal-sulfur cluster assembly factor [Agriterribacter sp.]HRP55361.1 metal-sulfur cluster assembly factor [Agriterribacter sp.]
MNVVTNNNIKSTIAMAALHNVIDPEIGLNVADLGLIYQIDFDESARKISTTMTLTTQFCPMGESIVDGVTQAMQQTFPEDTIQVDLTFDPPWSYDLISEEGRKFLTR